MLAYMLQLAAEKLVASLSIRKLDEQTLKGLRLRAARHGVSVEEEVRRILGVAVAAPERIGDLAVQVFGPANGVDLDLPQHPPHHPIDFDQ